jgi:hypothetical protein
VHTWFGPQSRTMIGAPAPAALGIIVIAFLDIS